MSMKELDLVLRNGYKRYLIESGYVYSGKVAGFHLLTSKFRGGAYLKMATMTMVQSCIDIRMKVPGLNY